MDFQEDDGEAYAFVEDSTTVAVIGVLAAGNHNAATLGTRIKAPVGNE